MYRCEDGHMNARTAASVICCAFTLVAIIAWLQASAAIASADADAAAIQALPNEDSGTAQCGPDRVTWKNARSFDVQLPGSATVHVTGSNGTQILDLSRPLQAGEKLIMLWCGDVLGSGAEALAYEAFSGGAHCCFSVTIVQLQPGARHLLDADLGNGGPDQFRQLDGSGPLELLAYSDVFAYFDHLTFAVSPFMPLVFAYDGSQYIEATRQFPEVIEAEIGRAEADLDQAATRGVPVNVPAQFAYEEQKSAALRLYGLHVLLGDSSQALPEIAARVLPPVAGWLEENAQAATDALAQYYDLATD
jgi:hypothetical protein